MAVKTLLVLTISLSVFAGPAFAAAADAPLVLESKIPLGPISGRIDHLAIDLRRERLFVAELGNDTVGVVDLKVGELIRNLENEQEPQGLGYVATTDTLYVAAGDSGTVDLYQGPDLTPHGQIALDDDADDIRVDPRSDDVLVGYGGGGIATIDSETGKVVADAKLAHHPEGFELSDDGAKIFVNVPVSNGVEVIDRKSGTVETTWSLHGAHLNFPMATDHENGRIVVATRFPARLLVFNAATGEPVYRGKLCGDSDDLFVDAKRNRVYVICGEGYVDTFAFDGQTYRRIGRIQTVGGARTGLFSPDLDRLYVAVRARGDIKPAVWVYRPATR